MYCRDVSDVVMYVIIFCECDDVMIGFELRTGLLIVVRCCSLLLEQNPIPVGLNHNPLGIMGFSGIMPLSRFNNYRTVDDT